MAVRKQKITRWVGPDGRRCGPRTPGATRTVCESRKWYGEVPREGARPRRVPLSTNKAVAVRMLARLLEEQEKARDTQRMKRPRVRAGCVYVVESGGAYKIGKAVDVAVRLSAIQVATPGVVALAHVIRSDDAVWLEAMLHRRFADRRVRGEWFALTQEDLAKVRPIGVWDRTAGPMGLVAVPDPFPGDDVKRA